MTSALANGFAAGVQLTMIAPSRTAQIIFGARRVSLRTECPFQRVTKVA
jgi:hypothetical protein